jgi:hypothetical protein
VIVQCQTCNYLAHAPFCSKCHSSVVTDEMVGRAARVLFERLAEHVPAVREAWREEARFALNAALGGDER